MKPCPMSSITVSIHSTGNGVCALTQKETDGLTVSFENEQPCFLSWKSFKQLLSLKTNEGAKPAARTVAALSRVKVERSGQQSEQYIERSGRRTPPPYNRPRFDRACTATVKAV